MPQLNFAWWLMNFIISWVAIIALITILLNKNIITNNTTFPQPSTLPTNKNQWNWN